MKISPSVYTTKEGITCTFRTPEKEDASKLLAHLLKASEESLFLSRYADEIKTTIEQEQAYIVSLGENPYSTMIAVFIDGELVGSINVNQKSPHSKQRHCANLGIALIKQYQGMGLGRKLMEMGEQWAREQGFSLLTLTVYSANTKALSLYASCGFQICGELPDAVHFRDGTQASEIYMYKRL